eukprot:CAMPEP_0115270760 /NCGR_PEP_ID=MMETSP0270-20121206/53739_1 /TAXON_ID=71861 /ORGANISM="Scrippsiella trochoidea, Strain CCMP3099" /LENGTH=239 /DNA_ID=CAMNT_0002687077 /DNA_START=32 /DNA_END=747 /DNA_ORIENTATION=+
MTQEAQELLLALDKDGDHKVDLQELKQGLCHGTVKAAAAPLEGAVAPWWVGLDPQVNLQELEQDLHHGTTKKAIRMAAALPDEGAVATMVDRVGSAGSAPLSEAAAPAAVVNAGDETPWRHCHQHHQPALAVAGTRCLWQRLWRVAAALPPLAPLKASRATGPSPCQQDEPGRAAAAATAVMEAASAASASAAAASAVDGGARRLQAATRPLADVPSLALAAPGGPAAPRRQPSRPGTQ